MKFFPDFERFGIKELSKDMIDLMKKRVYDLSGVISSNVKVFLNNKRLQVRLRFILGQRILGLREHVFADGSTSNCRKVKKRQMGSCNCIC